MEKRGGHQFDRWHTLSYCRLGYVSGVDVYVAGDEVGGSGFAIAKIWKKRSSD